MVQYGGKQTIPAGKLCYDDFMCMHNLSNQLFDDFVAAVVIGDLKTLKNLFEDPHHLDAIQKKGLLCANFNYAHFTGDKGTRMTTAAQLAKTFEHKEVTEYLTKQKTIYCPSKTSGSLFHPSVESIDQGIAPSNHGATHRKI